mgnify:CR=1 FL=1
MAAKKGAALPLNQQMAPPKGERGVARIMSDQAVEWVGKVGGDINAKAHLGRLFQEVRKNPSLAKCEPSSIIGCAMEAATLGLSFGNTLGQAYAVPYYDSKSRSWRAQFQAGYKGYISKMVDNVTTFMVMASEICENDWYDYDIGEGWIKHKPALSDRGPVVGAWAKAVHNNNVQSLIVIGIDEIEQARDASSSYTNAKKGGYQDKTPWGKYFGAMAMKTAVHRLAKLVPMSSNLTALIQSDGAVFTGIRGDRAESFNPEEFQQLEGSVDDTEG